MTLFICILFFLVFQGSTGDIAHKPPSNVIAVSPNDEQPQIFQCGSFNHILSSTTVQATVIPLPPDDYQGNYLRGLQFYDGPDDHSPFIGNGWDQSNIVSSGSSLTIKFKGNYTGYENVRVLVQATNDQIASYQGIHQEFQGTIKLKAANESVALITYTDAENGIDVITKVKGEGALIVYNGRFGQNQTNQIATYEFPQDELSFPQQFNGKFKTYVLINGKITLTVSRNPDDFTKSINHTRRGFISSMDYGIYSKNQDSEVTVMTAEKSMDISFDMKNVDLSNDANLTISGFNGMRLVFEENFKPNISNKAASFYGDTLTVQYKTNQFPSHGFFITFQMQNSENRINFIIICILIIINYWK